MKARKRFVVQVVNRPKGMYYCWSYEGESDTLEGAESLLWDTLSDKNRQINQASIFDFESEEYVFTI